MLEAYLHLMTTRKELPHPKSTRPLPHLLMKKQKANTTSSRKHHNHYGHHSTKYPNTQWGKKHIQYVLLSSHSSSHGRSRKTGCACCPPAADKPDNIGREQTTYSKVTPQSQFYFKALPCHDSRQGTLRFPPLPEPSRVWPQINPLPGQPCPS